MSDGRINELLQADPGETRPASPRVSVPGI
jgi:hypothetical protein